jgi:hypothetical protein
MCLGCCWPVRRCALVRGRQCRRPGWQAYGGKLPVRGFRRMLGRDAILRTHNENSYPAHHGYAAPDPRNVMLDQRADGPARLHRHPMVPICRQDEHACHCGTASPPGPCLSNDAISNLFRSTINPLRSTAAGQAQHGRRKYRVPNLRSRVAIASFAYRCVGRRQPRVSYCFDVAPNIPP